jgi:hypothetical protein
MPNKRITDLPNLNASQLTGDDLIYIVNAQADTSNKITFSALVGDSLITLSAYDTQNTLNVNYLSGSIDLNATAISLLDQGEVSLGSDINYLSGVIDTNYADFSVVSADFYNFEANSDIGNLVNDVVTLSTNLGSLSSEIYGVEGILEQQEDIFEVLENSVAPLSGDTISNTSYVSQVSTTPSTTSTLTATHYVPVNLGGTTYRMLLAVEL